MQSCIQHLKLNSTAFCYTEISVICLIFQIQISVTGVQYYIRNAQTSTLNKTVNKVKPVKYSDIFTHSPQVLQPM